MTNTRTVASQRRSIDTVAATGTSSHEPPTGIPPGAWVRAALVILSLACVGPQVADAQPPPPTGKRWVLAWSEDFNGSSLDWSKWNHRSEASRGERGHGGHRIKWRYEHDNVGLANGHLVLRNTRQSGDEYDLVKAAAIDTKGKFEQTYGYFEASIRIAPTGDGIHTAFWLQNDNRHRKAGNGGVDGPSDGAEIDILESVYTTDRYAMAVHWDGGRSQVEETDFPPLHGGQFHVYGLAWTPDSYTFYADGQRKEQMFDVVSHSDGYVILSTGLSWFAGNAHTGTFPNEALVDWVRVYELVDAPAITVTGSANVGRTLTASATGIQGEAGSGTPTFGWQWLVSDGDGDSYAEIAGATATEYTVRPSDQGKSLKVRATYTDADDTRQTVYSEPLLVTQPPTITSTGPFTVNEGETAVATLTATDGDTKAGELVWSVRGGVDGDHFTFTGGSSLAFRAAKDFEAPDDGDRDGSYEVVVRVGDGANTATDTLSITLADVDDEGGPELQSARGDGSALLLVFDEVLDASSTPATAAFAVAVNRVSKAISHVQLENNLVRLTLTGPPPALGDSVTASYTVPSSNPLRDVSGTPAASATIETLLKPRLTARFDAIPNAHGGAPFLLSVIFSEATTVAWKAMRDRVLTVKNGRVTRAVRLNHGGPENAAWQVTIEPAGGDVTVELPTTTDCGAGDAVCTEDERPLIEAVTATIAQGTVPPLTAEFSEAPGEHDGSEGFTVRLNFTAAVNVTETALRTRTLSVSGGRVESAEHEIGRRDRWLLTIAPTSLEDVTVALSSPASCGEADAVCAPDGRKLSAGADVRVKGPASIPLTAWWRPYYRKHDGSKVFTLNAEFSWPVATSREAVRDAVQVTNGEATDAFPRENQPKVWVFRIKPLYNETVRVTLLPASDCAAEGAICTDDGRPLSSTALWDVLPRNPNAVDETAPEVQGAEVDGAHLVLLYNEGLDEASTPEAGAFAVTVEGQARDLAANDPVAVDGRRVRLTLASAVGHGDTVTVSYTVPSSNPVQDRAGNTAAALSDEAATNHTPQDTPAGDTTAPELQGAEASTDSVVLTYSEALDESSTPAAAAFAVTVAGEARSLAATGPVAVSGSTVTLALDSAAAPGDTVEVSYTPPSADALQDTAGNRAASATIAAGVPADTVVTPVVTVPLTAEFQGLPERHDGGPFTFQLVFSEEFSISYALLRGTDSEPGAISVTGGGVTGAGRVVAGENRQWNITVEPGGTGDVTITLPETTDCGASGAICTGDSRPLSATVTATVAGETHVPAPELTLAGASATEGNATADFAVTLSRAATDTVTVDYATSDGTAAAGTDYTATSGTLTFAAGDTAKTVSVPVLDDAVDEEDETFTLTLSNASGASLADTAATGTIADNDTTATPLTATFEDMPASHDGSRISFGLTFSEEFSVSYQKLRDEAFEVTGGTVFGAQRKETGSNRRWTISVDPDSADIAVTITLPETADCNAAGAICAEENRRLSQSLTATVEGEAAAVPSLAVGEASATEGDEVTFTVSLSAASSRQVTVDYATSGGTAVSGTDFTAASGTLTFAAGDSSRTVSVATADDTVDENDESFTLTLSNASGATLGNTTATGTIVDNDTTTATPLTATFENMPETHHDIAFEFALKFSEEFPISYKTLRDGAFNVTGGEVTGARRRLRSSNLIWFIQVDPASANDTVTITLRETTDCDAARAICTADNRPLSHSLTDTVIDAASSASSDMTSGDVADDAAEALIVAGGISPDEAAAALFGEAVPGGQRLEALDRLGNRNGRYDLGDLLSWIDRCRRGEVRCGGTPAGSEGSAASAALLAATGPGWRKFGQPRRRRRDSGPGGRAPAHRAGRRKDPVRWALAALLVAAVAWSCTGDLTGPGAPEQDPGFVTVQLGVPAAHRATGVLLELEGPGIEAVRAPDRELYQSESPGRHQVIVAGSVTTGPLMRFRVPDRNRLPLYRVRVVQVAGEDYGLRDPGDYRAVITSN